MLDRKGMAQLSEVLHLRVQHGRDFDFGAAPQGPDILDVAASRAGVMGSDFPYLTFDPCVAEGDRVAAGQAVCTDRNQPQITLVAPVAGRVTAVIRGARRRLEMLEIAPEGDAVQAFATEAAQTDGADLRTLLLASGAWVAFRSRPFGRVPSVSAVPDAVFVTATDTQPLAANPAMVLAAQAEAFQAGVKALRLLTKGQVFVSQPKGPPLIPPTDRVVVVQVSGPHPAGQAGTQVHHLHPVTDTRSVWEISAQEVAAIGHLLTTDQVLGTRVYALAGSGVTQPQLLRTALGARLSDLTKGRLRDQSATLLSGSPLGGRAQPYIGRGDLQVTAIAANAQPVRPRSMLWQWLARFPETHDGAMLPSEAFERAFPFDILPAPLMRALATGDVETAHRLGCLELLEDDMALLTVLCPSGLDYAALLRRTLDVLAQEADV